MTEGPARLVRIVAEAKGVALQLLRQIGIEDNFLVRVKPAASARKLRRHDSSVWIALYRARSQFMGWSRPIFWISADIERVVAKCERGYLTCSQLAYETSRVIVDSLIHEYGHVIWEFAELRYPDLRLLIEHYIIGAEGGEETFAEDFMKLCRGDELFMDGDPALLRQIVQAYTQKLRETLE